MTLRSQNRSVGFSPGKLRIRLFNNGVFNRKLWLTTEDTEHTEIFGTGKILTMVFGFVFRVFRVFRGHQCPTS